MSYEAYIRSEGPKKAMKETKVRIASHSADIKIKDLPYTK
jgi:hypothetical protein